MRLGETDIEKYAGDFVSRLAPAGARASVVALRGDLGAGKTTLVKAIAKHLGVREEVTSPTFVIAQAYDTTHPVYARLIHIDAYRLSGEMGDTIGFSDYVKDPRNIICVEWPEHLPADITLSPTYEIDFETIDEHTREVVVKRGGEVIL